jgi:lanthanide-dependent methanol dehydrogenase
MFGTPLRGVLIAALALVAGCGGGERELPVPGDHSDYLTVSPQRGAAAGLPQPIPPEDGQWLLASKDPAAIRFSGLDQITAGNAGNLRLAWTFPTGQIRGHEAAPLVAGDTMFIVTPFPNQLLAIDLSTGSLKWSYEPEPLPASQGVACCDLVNRGAAYEDGRLFFNTLDNVTVAVDAGSGAELWRVRLGDVARGETMTMAPLAVNGIVYTGSSGGEFGARGWLAALDAGSGAVLWRAYSTGSDAEVLIGTEFRPFYEHDRGADLGIKTWPPQMWQTGGGSVDGWISYDAALNLIYHGTGSPAPRNRDQRPGDNKWTGSIFARDATTGAARWAYQAMPHDGFGWDGVNENILLDLPVDGVVRQLLVRPERNGFVYVIDRATGEVISADPYGFSSTVAGIDSKSGRPELVEEKKSGSAKVVRDICPASPGAKNWQPSSFSPHSGLLYIPHQNLCMDLETVEASYIAGTPFLGTIVRMYPGPGGHRGELTAWDPVRRATAWKIRERFPVWSGTLATAGDVVFYGTMEGWFKAVHALTGELLWKFRTESGIVGQPVSYRGPDGKQYVAVLAGVGGWAGAIVAADLDPRDGTAARGFVNAMDDLPLHTKKGGMLYVFALP